MNNFNTHPDILLGRLSMCCIIIGGVSKCYVIIGVYRADVVYIAYLKIFHNSLWASERENKLATGFSNYDCEKYLINI